MLLSKQECTAVSARGLSGKGDGEESKSERLCQSGDRQTSRQTEQRDRKEQRQERRETRETEAGEAKSEQCLAGTFKGYIRPIADGGKAPGDRR